MTADTLIRDMIDDAEAEARYHHTRAIHAEKGGRLDLAERETRLRREAEEAASRMRRGLLQGVV